MSAKNILKNTSALVLVQFANYLAPLLVLPYLSRILGIESFGMLMISLSLCSIGFLITDYGFNLSASYWIAKHRNSIKQVSRYIGATYLIKIFIFSCFCIALLLYGLWGETGLASDSVMLFLISGVVLSQTYQPLWFFQGIEKMTNVTIYMVASKLTYLLFVLTFVKGEQDKYLVLTGLCFSNLLATAIALWAIYHEGYRIAKPGKMLVKYAFKTSTGFFISRTAVSLYTSASTFIVGNYSGLQQAAMYSSAEKLYMAGQSMTSPVSQALYPYLARTKDKKILFKYILFTMPVIIIGCFFVGLFAPFFLHLFYGNGFDAAAPILRVFLVCMIVTFVSINLGYPAFAAIGKIKQANKTVLLGGGIHLSLLVGLYLTNSITSIHVAICVLITESFVLLFRCLLLYFYIKNES
jgi:O-antigen/teichoic acid export membrane protein